MVKYFILVLLLIVLGANIYFFRSPSEELSSATPEYRTKKEMLNDPELSQGMERIMEKKNEDHTDPAQDNFIEDFEPADGGRETDLSSFRKQGMKAEKRAFQKVHTDDIRILERELERDSELLAKHMREGNEEYIQQMKEEITKKQKLLEYLQNNPPEEEAYEQ